MLHQEKSVLDNLVREFINDKTYIETDSRFVYNKLKKDLPRNIEIKLAIKNKEIFRKYNIDDEIKNIFFKKIKLKNGAFILVEEKEGLTVIDINSGSSLNNKKETLLNINKIAATEISRQIVLRNLHGLILIDFIDVKKPKEKKEIFKTLYDSMRSDKSKHTILPMSKFGIIEMTRQKRGSKISNIIGEKCLVCNGYGLVQNKVSVCYEVLENVIKNNIKGKVSIKINSTIYQNMKDILNKHKNNSEIKKIKFKLIQDFEPIYDNRELYEII